MTRQFTLMVILAASLVVFAGCGSEEDSSLSEATIEQAVTEYQEFCETEWEAGCRSGENDSGEGYDSCVEQCECDEEAQNYEQELRNGTSSYDEDSARACIAELTRLQAEMCDQEGNECGDGYQQGLLEIHNTCEQAFNRHRNQHAGDVDPDCQGECLQQGDVEADCQGECLQPGDAEADCQGECLQQGDAEADCQGECLQPGDAEADCQGECLQPGDAEADCQGECPHG